MWCSANGKHLAVGCLRPLPITKRRRERGSESPTCAWAHCRSATAPVLSHRARASLASPYTSEPHSSPRLPRLLVSSPSLSATTLTLRLLPQPPTGHARAPSPETSLSRCFQTLLSLSCIFKKENGNRPVFTCTKLRKRKYVLSVWLAGKVCKMR